MRSERAAAVGVVVVATALRLPRVIARWDEVALAYAAYAEPAVRALEAGSLAGALTAWVGLHPPLHAVLLGVSELVLPVPLLWLGFSAACSVAAVGAVTRLAGPVPGLVLATAPLQLAYAAEVNNYPLAIAALALLLLAARAPWGWLVAAAGLACWSHLLGAAAAGAVVAWRLVHPVAPRERLPLAAGSALLALPVVVGAVRLVAADTTFIQPEVAAGDWGAQVLAAVGPVGVALAAVGLAGLGEAPGAALLGAGALLAASLASHAAAAHQLPYLALLGVPLAASVGLALRRAGAARGWVAGAVVAACLGRGGVAAVEEWARVVDLNRAQAHDRGLDHALADSAPGDVVWVVAPALQADDDKTATSALMWRLPPWSRMPRVFEVPFEYRDWRYGQPRGFRGRAVHTSTELAEAPFDHVARAVLARGGRVWVVLADHAPATGLADRVARAVRPYAVTRRAFPTSEGLGDDLVWRIDGVAP